MTNFMFQHISSIDTDQMADMVADQLKTVAPEVDKKHVLRHIQEGHTLHPQLQMILSLRGLIELRDNLYPRLMTEDIDGNRTVDSRNMNAYLKTTNEIGQYYRNMEKFFVEK